MKVKIGLSLILFLFILTPLIEVYASPTERENFHHGDTYNSRFTYGGSSYLCETFLTPSAISSTHTVTSVKLYSGYSVDAGDFTSYIDIKATDVNGKPTGSALSTGSLTYTQFVDGTMKWREWIMSPEITLSTNTLYAIVARATITSIRKPYWGYDIHDGYADGKLFYSSNSGSSWTESVGNDNLFQIWGNDATASITITSTYTGTGYIKVNGTSQTTPYTNTYIIGTWVNVEALSPKVIYSNVEQKVYTSWSDSGSQTHNIVVILGGGTYTANYHTEYKHIINANPISGTGILNIDNSARTSPYTTGWLDSGGTISLNCTLFPTGHNGYVFDYWVDNLIRHHHVTPTTSYNYTAYYIVPPFYGNSTINISGNATVTVNTIPHALSYSFNAIAGSEYNITAIAEYVLSGNVTLNVDGNATITLDTILIVTPDSFDFVIGSIHNITANDALSSPSINISNLNFIIGVLIFVPIGLILVLIIRGRKR